MFQFRYVKHRSRALTHEAFPMPVETVWRRGTVTSLFQAHRPSILQPILLPGDETDHLRTAACFHLLGEQQDQKYLVRYFCAPH
jgi:hypothetical protein